MLDNIEQNLLETENYLEKAETHLTNAENTNKKNRSKMCYIMFFLIIGGLVLVLWLAGVF